MATSEVYGTNRNFINGSSNENDLRYNSVENRSNDLNNHQQSNPNGLMPYQAAMNRQTIRWIPDTEIDTCKSCGLLFDWVRRKHHCRLCGNIFCDLCTAKRSLIPEDRILSNPARSYLSISSHNPQRVCETCHETLLPYQEELRQTSSNAVQPNVIQETGSKRFMNSPFSFTLREEIRKAAYSVNNFLYDGVIKDQSIPLPLLTNAKGLAFLTVVKAGFFVSGRLGTGLVISKLPNGQWSAPSAIGTAGIGWGAQIGGEVTDFVIILNTRSAVDTFSSQGQVNLGAELGVAAGPVGRVAAGAVEASPSGIAPCYSYSHSKGLFIGISLEGSVIAARPDVNRSFYGKEVTAGELLNGAETPPVAGQPLYEALYKVLTSPANSLNRFSATSGNSNRNSNEIPVASTVPVGNKDHVGKENSVLL